MCVGVLPTYVTLLVLVLSLFSSLSCISVSLSYYFFLLLRIKIELEHSSRSSWLLAKIISVLCVHIPTLQSIHNIHTIHKLFSSCLNKKLWTGTVLGIQRMRKECTVLLCGITTFNNIEFKYSITFYFINIKEVRKVMQVMEVMLDEINRVG